MGNQLEAAGDYDRALALDPSIELEAKCAEAYRFRGIYQSEQGNYVEAAEDYDRALMFDPSIELEESAAVAFHGRGSRRADCGKHVEAIADYGKAHELNPRFATAILDRGVSRTALGLYVKAIGDFSKAGELEPENGAALYNRGVANLILDDYRIAIRDFDRAIELNPKCAEALLNRGFAFSRLGQQEKAIDDFVNCIALERSNGAASYFCGVSCIRSDRLMRASEHFDNALILNPDLELTPKDTIAYYYRGKDEMSRGRFEEAARYFSRAIKYRPTRRIAARCHYLRGVSYRNLRVNRDIAADFDRAIILDPAIKLAPEDAQAWLGRSIRHMRLGQHSQAKSDFWQALAVSREHVSEYCSNKICFEGPLRNYRDFREAVEKHLDIREIEKYLETIPGYIFASNTRGFYGRANEYRREVMEALENGRAYSRSLHYVFSDLADTCQQEGETKKL